MSTNILIPFYSSYGHTFQMAEAVGEGAERVESAEVELRRVAELEGAREAMSGQDAYDQAQEEMSDIPEATLDDLRWADGVCWGTPTRFGNMSAQMKQFIDSAGSLWQNGELEGKPAGVFVSTGTIHGGQETTILSSFIPLIHLGMVLVGTPYGENPHIMTTEGEGGSPYGPTTLADTDGSRQPIENEFKSARNLGERVAKAAKQLDL
jgi:NAD(P)H dehydrogenase (quinone)